MRILLLTDQRETARAYRDAADQYGNLRLCVLKNIAQVLECLYRESFDALLADDPMILHSQIRNCHVRWPDLTFLLVDKPIETAQIPDDLTFCFLRDNEAKDVLKRVAGFPKGPRYICDTKQTVSGFLQQAGVPVSLNGFAYLCTALRLILSQDHPLDIQKVNAVYAFVSMTEGVSVSVAEHAIRTAIDVAWMRADTSLLEQLFGYTVRSDRGAPSNAAFLFRAADHIKLTREGKSNDFGRNACDGE